MPTTPNDGPDFVRTNPDGTKTIGAYKTSEPDHPHAGRIAAVAHLSAALALADCAIDALAEDGIYSPEEQINDARYALRTAADTIMEPCEISNVLETIEEVIQTGALPTDRDGPFVRAAWTTRRGRETILRALVDVRQAAKEDETRAEPNVRECCDTLDDERHHHECPEAEPTDDEIYNRHGMEGGIPYAEPNPSGYREDDHV
jgi:hypothetical protein